MILFESDLFLLSFEVIFTNPETAVRCLIAALTGGTSLAVSVGHFGFADFEITNHFHRSHLNYLRFNVFEIAVQDSAFQFVVSFCQYFLILSLVFTVGFSFEQSLTYLSCPQIRVLIYICLSASCLPLLLQGYL